MRGDLLCRVPDFSQSIPLCEEGQMHLNLLLLTIWRLSFLILWWATTFGILSITHLPPLMQGFGLQGSTGRLRPSQEKKTHCK